jgi:hypothetical protein
MSHTLGESWRNGDLSSAELYKQLRGIKGFGDYAAGSMMRLLGRFRRSGTALPDALMHRAWQPVEAVSFRERRDSRVFRTPCGGDS